MPIAVHGTGGGFALGREERKDNMGIWSWISGNGHTRTSAPDDLVIEFIGGRTVRVPSGTSLTIGSGPKADHRLDDASVAPMHARINNGIVPPGYEPSHPYCQMAWVADIGGTTIGEDLFGPNSRTGVVQDVTSGFAMPLEPGETAPLRVGTIVVIGQAQFKVVSGA